VTELVWESAGHDEEPRDQNADTALVDHGYWSMGPESDNEWSLTLIEQNPDLEEIFLWEWRAPDEPTAKQLAKEAEAAGTPPPKYSDTPPDQPE
jgi:hypothetical protein